MSEIKYKKKSKVGFIGMGIMGLAMALNAKKAGYTVRAYNRSQERSDHAKNQGLDVLKSPKELTEASDVIITMVTGPAALKEILYQPGGVFGAEGENKTLIQMSTIDPHSTQQLAEDAAEKKMRFLDCPVAGSKIQVEAGQLIILAGADEEDLLPMKDLLLSMGKAIVHAGGIGKGTALKLCMNLIVSQMTTALCEAVALSKVMELPPEKIFEVIGESPALQCGYFSIKKNAILNNDFSPAFSLANMLKDVRFMDHEAKSKRLALPVTQAVKFVMESALQEGLGEEDLSSLVKILHPKVEK